jgi:NADP-dependent 3-hydroxy acid dehydrogenase YdfG
MKIAITGHSAGIGLALSQAYQRRGHEIVGLSRRNGHNIRASHRFLDKIAECDVFVNNAQAGFSQTELLFQVYEIWRGNADKKIINISTMMATEPVSNLPELNLYRVQKLSLEQAHYQLRHNSTGPRLVLVRPGAVATQPGQGQPDYADPEEWAESLLACFETVSPRLNISEISLGVFYDS